MSKKKAKSQVVGFFREDGKTKPVTKPKAELKRKKVVAKPKKFPGIKPIHPEGTPEWSLCLDCEHIGPTRKFQGGVLIQDLRPLMRTKEDFLKNLDKIEKGLNKIQDGKCPECGSKDRVNWMGKKTDIDIEFYRKWR